MMRIHQSILRRFLGLALAATLIAPGLASASIGAGVGAVPLTLSGPAHPGRNYTFHWLYVKDTGTVASDYLVKVERLAPVSGRPIPVDWVRVVPVAFHLQPKAIERVTITVAIPYAAPSGSYMTDLVATTFTPHRGSGTSLGAAAADKLSFTIPSTSSFPWIIVIIVGGIAVLVALWYGVRRSGLQLRLDRSRAAA